MNKAQAIWLWNSATGHEFGGEWGGSIQYNALGGAALARGINPQLNQMDFGEEARSKAACFLREWADALEGK